MTTSSPCADRVRLSRWVAAVATLAVVWTAGVPAEAAGFRELYDKGVTSYGAGRYEEAIGHFEAAFAIKAHPLCLFNIGQSYRKLDDIDQAIAAYEKYLATGPSADLAKETEGYLADLRRAKKGVTLASDGFGLMETGDFAAAAKRFEEAYALRPRPSYLYYLGVALGSSGDDAGAIAAFEKFLARGGAVELRGEATVHLESLRAGKGLVVEEPPVPEPGDDGGGPETAATDGGGSTVLGPPDVGDGGASSAGIAATVMAPASKKKKKTALWAGIGVGAGVLVAGGVVLAVVLAVTLNQPPDTQLGGQKVEF